MNTPNEWSQSVAFELATILDEDLISVMNDLGLNVNKALDKLNVIYHNNDKLSVEYSIVDKCTVEVYKHRKINLDGHIWANMKEVTK